MRTRRHVRFLRSSREPRRHGWHYYTAAGISARPRGLSSLMLSFRGNSIQMIFNLAILRRGVNL